MGADAFDNSNYLPKNPIQHGIVQDWNSMEKIFDYSIYHQLHCNPEDHYFLITEPFNNTPVCILFQLACQDVLHVLFHSITHRKIVNIPPKSCSKPSMSPVCTSPPKQFYVCMLMDWFLLLLK